MICEDGWCTACPPGETRGGFGCQNLSSGMTSCGECGKEGHIGETCCNGICTDLQYNETGGDSWGNSCPAGQPGLLGSCTHDAVQERGFICGPGHIECGGRCISDSSFDNCGSCGHRCDPGEGCCHGICNDTLYDSANCGMCEHRCASPPLAWVRGMCLDIGADPENCDEA